MKEIAKKAFYSTISTNVFVETLHYTPSKGKGLLFRRSGPTKEVAFGATWKIDVKERVAGGAIKVEAYRFRTYYSRN